MTGISGGGAATFWIAAADERVKVAVPVSGMSDLECYVKNKIINGHCDCMFLYNTYQWDWTTIAALIAPRPLLFANSDADPIFPMDGNRRIIAKPRGLYKLAGKSDLVDDYVSHGGHAYRPDLRVAIFKFINKHLKGDTTTPVEDAKFAPVPGKDLRVFPTDADLPKDAINGKIDETFVPRAKVTLPEKGKFEQWQKEMIAKLLRQSLHHLGDWQEKVGPVPAGKQEKRPVTLNGVAYWPPVFFTEPGIERMDLLFRNTQGSRLCSFTTDWEIDKSGPWISAPGYCGRAAGLLTPTLTGRANRRPTSWPGRTCFWGGPWTKDAFGTCWLPFTTSKTRTARSAPWA